MPNVSPEEVEEVDLEAEEVVDMEENGSDYFPNSNTFDHQPMLIIPMFDELPLASLRTPNNMYRCPVCHHEIYNKSNFRHHYMIHSDERPYRCSFCSYQARQTGSLNKHMKLKHSDCMNDAQLAQHSTTQWT